MEFVGHARRDRRYADGRYEHPAARGKLQKRERVPEIKCLVDSRCRLAESPVWDRQNERLYWCDILAGTLHAIDLLSGRRRCWRFEGHIGSFGLARSGRLILAISDTIYLFDLQREELTPIVRIIDSWPMQRLNDGKVGPDGAFWVGSMDTSRTKQPVAALYRVTGSGQVERKIQGLKVSNGLAWSLDGCTLFHSDSHMAWIDRWNFDPRTGDISAQRRIRQLADEEGRPDGAATDVRGGYWSAGVSSGCLNRFDAEGRLHRRIPIPVAAPTMPCFGGTDMRTLFITSLREGLSAERLSSNPQSGGVLMLRLDVAGVPVTYFAD
jgi:sugar lactone lactonase YvrE